MRVLGLDSALTACSAALWQDGEILARRMEVMPRGQSEALMPMAVAVMGEADLAFEELDRLGVTVGPGSFTGLRIGLAAARGMAVALRLPLVGVTTLEAVAWGVPREERAEGSLLVALDAERLDLYVQVFAADLEELGPVSALRPESVPAILPEGPLVVAGNGAPRLREALGPRAGVRLYDGPGLPDAAQVAAIAAARTPVPAPGRGRGAPAPFYVHPPYAKIPRPARR
jgi:tRNA threonylcarbamoyladenosine biosynthesis protein TsaB